MFRIGWNGGFLRCVRFLLLVGLCVRKFLSVVVFVFAVSFSVICVAWVICLFWFMLYVLRVACWVLLLLMLVFVV